jgi:ribose 5-phosphate isomerase RpiB
VAERDLDAILDAWLDTPFEGGRHARRIREIDEP